MKLDNFMLSTHQTCPSKFDLRFNENWTVRRKSAALGFGGAIHAGLAEWYRWGPNSGSRHVVSGNLTNPNERLDRAINAIRDAFPADHPVDDYRTLGKCIEVMNDYARVYPAESFRVLGLDEGKPMVEQTFCLLTGLYLSCFICGPDHHDPAGVCPNCGEPLEAIEYGGIFDTLVDFQGQIYILEHKSTSMLGSTYPLQFKPNNQVTGYVWGASGLSGRPVSGTIVNAIGVYKSSATKFERFITSRNKTDIDEWLKDVRAVAEEIQHHRRTGYWPRRTAACTIYGTCEYHGVHSLTTEFERQKRLESDYVKSNWNFEAPELRNNA